jgi:hypothetical protein
MSLKIDVSSSLGKSVSFGGDYTEGDLLESNLNIDYAVSGTASYKIEISPSNVSNEGVSVIARLGTISISLNLPKTSISSGESKKEGSVLLEIYDLNSSESEAITVSYLFTITNLGNYLPLEPFSLISNGLSISTELKREDTSVEVSRQVFPTVDILGGVGPFTYSWTQTSFDHFLIVGVGPLNSESPAIKFFVNSSDLPENLFVGGRWTQTGVFEVTVRDEGTGFYLDTDIPWSFTVSVDQKDTITQNDSRLIPGRFRVRNPANNGWFDLCRDEIYVYDKNYSNWVRLYPNKTFIRDGGNKDWLEISCVADEDFDDLCPDLSSEGRCNGSPHDSGAGSGNGMGSDGADYSLFTGYPEGYDLPDSYLGGFGVTIAQKVTGSETPVGFIIHRPGLQVGESYDPTGLSPDEGARGTFFQPNINGASTFSRGSSVTETIYELVNRNGYYELIYTAYTGISIDVYYVGERVATTCGRIPKLTRGILSFNLNLTLGEGDRRVMVRVRGSEDSRWLYKIEGPTDSPRVQDFDPRDEEHYVKVQAFLYENTKMLSREYIGTPVFPAPCHSTVGNYNKEYPWYLSYRVEDKNFFEYYHYVGNNGGPMVLDFNSWDSSDYVEVWQNGVRIATSQNYHQSFTSLDFIFEPRDGVQDLLVRVHTLNRGLGENLSNWYYNIFCPNSLGHIRKPWNCGQSVIYSMGHPCTEDNFNLDNGVDRGAFKVVVKNATSSTKVSVFSRGGHLITSVTGEGDFEAEAFNFDVINGDVYKDIYVRVEASIGQSWEYYVSCPINLLDIELTPIEADIAWTIEDIIVYDTEEYVDLTVSIDRVQMEDRTIEFNTSNGSAFDQTDYCSLSGEVTVPAGMTTTTIRIKLAPC